MRTRARRVFHLLACAGFASVLLLARPAANGVPTRLLRSPTGSATQIAFAYANNIWIVERAGGAARRLTSFPGETANPHFSPDGMTIAFSGEYAGNVDVYTVPAEGGDPRRLTWHPGPDLVQGWMPGGKSIVFSTSRATWAPSGAPRFWTVPVEGGVEQPMPLPRAYQGKISDDGTHVAYRMNNSWDEERRNYRGGQNRPIWIVDLKTYDLISPPWTDSKDVDPVWLGDTVYFLSDRDGVEARGEVFTVPAEKGDVRNLSHSSGSAERDPAWSPDGKHVSYFSDKSGEYKLVIETQDGLTPPREIALEHPTHYYTPSWSPDSKKIVFSDTNLRVWVMDVDAGKAKIVGNDPWMVPQRTLNPVWSPDSKWVAYSSRLKSMYHAVFVSNVDTGETKQVTDGLADAVWPAWDASGKYLWFLASTDFGLKSQWLDMTSYDHNETFGLYLAVLKKDEPSPLLPESDEDTGVTFAPGRGEFGGSRPSSASGRGGGRGATPPETTPETGAEGTGEAQQPSRTSNPPDRAPRPPVNVQIDFDGLQHRIITVQGIPERQYSKLLAGVAGTVYYLEAGAPGAGRGRGGEDDGAAGTVLHRYRLTERRAATFVSGAADYTVSADGHKLLYRTGGAGGRGGRGAPGATPAGPSLFLVDADRNPPQA